MPDTAHNCPILRIGVVHNQPASERENLLKEELFYFLYSLLLHHKTTVISIKIWYRMEEKIDLQGLAKWWRDDRQVSQSGKPLCTGASLWAVPKLARGLRPASVGAKRTSTGCLAPLWNPLTARSPLAKLYMTAQR